MGEAGGTSRSTSHEPIRVQGAQHPGAEANDAEPGVAGAGAVQQHPGVSRPRRCADGHLPPDGYERRLFEATKLYEGKEDKPRSTRSGRSGSIRRTPVSRDLQTNIENYVTAERAAVHHRLEGHRQRVGRLRAGLRGPRPPRYLQIQQAAYDRSDVRRGWAGTVTARLRDVAEQAGVSIGLVSRILNGDPRVRASASTRAWVSSIANDLGYRPNVTARALKSARTDTLGVVAPDLTNAFFTELMCGIDERAGQLGYTVLLGRAESMYGGGQVARMVEHSQVDGFILQGRDDESIESLTRLVSGAPSVLVHGRLGGHPGSVMFDDSYAAHLATSHLIAHGHRRIGLIGGLPGLLTAQRREHGYRRALVDHGLRPQSRLITHFGYHPHEARAGLEELIASGPMPTAVVVANVNAALGVLTAARNFRPGCAGRSECGGDPRLVGL